MRVPVGGASCLGVGRPGSGALPSPTARPLGGLPGPTTHWLWLRGMRAWGPVTNPTARALACCAGGMRVPGGGASRLGVERPGSGALPPPTTRPFGRAAVARFPLAVGAVCGRGGWALLGTLSRAAVRRVLCALPGFAAPGGRCGLAPVLVPWLWPAACRSGVPRGPALVRRSSSGPVALGALVGFPVAVVPSPSPGAVAPGITGWLRGARGGRPRTWLIVPAAGPYRGKGAGRAPRRTRSGPRDGVVPGGALRLRSWAACAAVVRRVWARSLTRPVSRTVRLATGDSAGAPGLFRVDADTDPFGSEDATPGSRACGRVRALLGRVGRASLPGAFWCASPFLWPFLARSLLVRPPPGWGCPVCGCCGVFLWFFLFCFFSRSLPRCAPVVSCFACFLAPGALGLGVLSPPPFFFSSPPCVRPVVSCFAFFPAWVALGFGVFLPPPPLFFFCPPPLPVVSGVSCFPVALGLCAPPPPPLFFLGFLFFLFPCNFFLFFFPFFFCRLCGAGRVCVSLAVGCASVVLSLSLLCVRWLALCGVGCWARLSSAVSSWVLVSCFGGAVLVWPRGLPPCGSRGVFSCPAAVCCVLLRGAVVWWCVVVLCNLFASLPVPVVCFLPLRVCFVCSGVSCCVFPVLPVRCAVRVVCAVSGGWCCWFLVSLPFVGDLLVALVARRCRLVVCVGSGARVWSGRRWASSLW